MKTLVLLCIIYTTLSRVTIIDESNILNSKNNLQNTEEVCAQLKSQNLENIKIVYVNNEQKKSVKQSHSDNFQTRFLNFTKTDVIFKEKNSKKQFFKCLRNLNTAQLSINSMQNEQLEDIFENNENQKILLFIDNEQRDHFMFSERILPSEKTKVGEKLALGDATKNNINLYPNGLFGVVLIVVFLLIVGMTFVLILNTGDFNPKFVKERMPLGREYQFI